MNFLVYHLFSKIQFGLMAIHWLALMASPECGYPKFIAFFMLPQNFFIFILFYDFYRKAYHKKSQVESSESMVDLNNNETEVESSTKHESLKENLKSKEKTTEFLDYDKTFAE